MKALKTKKAKEERLMWFESWLDTIDERLNKWLYSLDDELRKLLDVTPDSLIPLEKYILSRFDTPRLVRKVENEKETDAIATYIGQVLINNLPDRPRWEVSMEDISGFDTFFLPFISRPKPLISFKVFGELPYLVNMREGDILIKMYKNEVRQYEKYRDQIVPFEGQKEELEVNIDKGYAYQRFLLINEPSFTLGSVGKIITDYCNSRPTSTFSVKKKNERYLLMTDDSGYTFHFDYDDTEVASQESEEIAEGYVGGLDKNDIASCKTRIEFWGDGDEEMDYFNEFMWLMGLFIDKVLIYDFKEGSFMNE